MKILRAAAAATILFAGIAAHAEPERATLIRGARVFDGSGAPAVVENVLVRGDRIVAVAPRLRAPRGARVIDARGLTLTPGLHDLHTHLRSPAYDAPDDMAKSWAGYLVNGVTSVNDYSVSGEMLAPIREMPRPALGHVVGRVKARAASKSQIITMRLSPDEDFGGKVTKVSVRADCFSGGVDQLPWDQRKPYDEFDYGYVLTVHKSQGSQWDDVVLFDESFAFQESRARWLYTGITRAAKRLSINIPVKQHGGQGGGVGHLVLQHRPQGG
eukprot:gene41188-55700_t